MKLPVWVLALSATLLVQTAASFMNQCLPVVAPLLTASTGLAPQRIGNLTSLGSVGTVLFLAFGSAILARLGPVRSLQLGAGLAVVALLIAATGFWPALVLAALMLGVGYGPTPPAGSRILAATAPAGHLDADLLHQAGRRTRRRGTGGPDRCAHRGPVRLAACAAGYHCRRIDIRRRHLAAARDDGRRA